MAKKLYAIYKPYNMLSQFTREIESHVTLADLDYPFERDVYPIGRLDADSEGLLLLTNDTTLNKKLLNPSSKQPKTYWVQVEGSITEECMRALSDGVSIRINGKVHLTAPARIESVNDVSLLPDRNPPIRYRKDDITSWLSITLTEGKNRQVRRMCASVGLPVLRLVRVRIGDISIFDDRYSLLESGAIAVINHN